MPQWLSILLGIVGGLAVIGGAIYFAFRPYLAVKPPTGWMPEQRGRMDGDSITGVMPLNPHDLSA